MKQKISLRRFGKPISYLLIALMLLPVLLSATAPRVVAEPGWVTPSAVSASSEKEDNLLADFENLAEEGWVLSHPDDIFEDDTWKTSNEKSITLQTPRNITLLDGHESFTGWTKTARWETSTGWVTQGTYSFRSWCGSSTDDTCYKNFDLTNVQRLIIDLAGRGFNAGQSYRGTGYIYVNDIQKYSKSTGTQAYLIEWKNQEIDVSGVSGTVPVKYRFYGDWGDAEMYWDYLRGVLYTPLSERTATKTINLTNTRALTIDVKNSFSSPSSYAAIYLNETKVWEKSGSGTFLNQKIDATNYSGDVEVKLVCHSDSGTSVEAVSFDKLRVERKASCTIDENTFTPWTPSPENEIGAWCRWDAGSLKIIGGCQIYWGVDSTYRPTSYRIQISENTTDWTTVVTETEAAPASAWKEYSWTPVKGRYIRLIVDTHGSSGTEIYEMDYAPADNPPNAPANLLCEGGSNPIHVNTLTPKFSAICTDDDGEGDILTYYALQVDNDSDFGTPIWNRTKASIAAFYSGSRCPDITYAGDSLSYEVTYYWRIKFWDYNDYEGDWSTEIATFKLTFPPTIENITVNNSLVDRKKDDTASSAVTTTTITVRVQDNNGVADIDRVGLWIRDNQDTVRIDNLALTSYTDNSATARDYTYVYNPADSLPDDNLGAFDVKVVVKDLWDASGTEDYDGMGAALFTVDDDNTTFNFDPTNPYYRWEENVSGTISRIVGSASADNVWFKDNIYNEWWYLGSGNTWSENYIVNAEPDENVKVWLKVYDPPLDGLITSSYIVNENWQFQINLRWEDNFELFADPKGTENSIENQGIWAVFHFIEYEESEQQITDNIATFTVSHEADYVRVVFLLGTDNEYSRRYIIDSREINAIGCEKEDLANLSLYTFKIYEEDTYTWGPPEGRMGIFKFHENQRYYVVKRYWTGTSDASVWLKFGQDYNLWLYTPTEGGIDYGTIQGDINYVKSVYPSRFGLAISEEIVSTFSDVIAWSYYIDVYGNLVIEYLDNSEGTNWVFINVTELENYTVAWYDNVTDSPNDFLTTWNGYENNVLYDISLQINHDNFGFSPVWSWGMTGITTPISEWDWGMLGEATGKLGNLPVAFLNLAVLGLSILILASFESGAVGFGVVALAIILGMLKLILPIPLDWTVLSILAFLGVVSQIFRRRGK